MAKKLGFGVSTGMPIGDTIAAVREAENAGFDSAWVVESSLTPGKDAISYLGALAVSTSKLQLATGIINVYSRSPTLIASTMATLDEISHGRMILGIGTGHRVVTDYHSIGFENPTGRLREYIQVFRKLVAGERVEFNGDHVKIRGLKLNIQSVRPRIPVYVATVGEKLAQIAGGLADGVLFVLTSPSRVKQLVAAVQEGAKAAGRNPEDIDVACYLPIFGMKDPEEALSAARATVAGYARSVFYRRLYKRMGYGKEAAALKEAWRKGGLEEAASQVPERMAREVVVVGSWEECRRRVEEYRLAGVSLPILQPHYKAGGLDLNVRPCIRAFQA